MFCAILLLRFLPNIYEFMLHIKCKYKHEAKDLINVSPTSQFNCIT